MVTASVQDQRRTVPSRLRRSSTTVVDVVAHLLVSVLLLALALAVLYPLAWMLISGFKTNFEIFSDPWGLPATWRVENFVAAANKGVTTYFVNSLLVTAGSIVSTTMISAWAAYGLARTKAPLVKYGGWFILGGLMVSPTVALVPLFGLLQQLRLFDSLVGLVVLYTAYRIPFTTFLIRAYMVDLPTTLDEAATIDGAGRFQIFWRVILPLSKPILVSAALLQALFSWNEFAFALVFLSRRELKTLPVGLMDMQSRLLTDWPVQFASLALAALPMILVFLIGQRAFLRGLTDGMGK
ncbi:MAG: carbohydrate ABC transporter permease [Micropruina sp.]|nr:carbohydrate ABC transporter permease [Micropruina sp.]